jgi:hypothetical protein
MNEWNGAKREGGWDMNSTSSMNFRKIPENKEKSLVCPP